MKEYTVKQISKMLDTNPETVRRWIRTGKLEATQSSKKGGNIVSDVALQRFLKDAPKYAEIAALSVAQGVAAATTPLLLPVVVGALTGNLIKALFGQGGGKISAEEIRNRLCEEVQKSEKSIKRKKELAEQLQKELAEEQTKLETLKNILNQGDFEEIATEINLERNPKTVKGENI